ncbi:MAG: Gfo/Idh/MocA family oxidoreductase [Rhodothermales bacterium]|nr:Gfo/Idh/MocA family oxidoreductase [Rhodothermales bacterium]
MSSDFKLGVVGLGGHGQTIQNAIDKADGLSIGSVFDLSAEERRRSVDRFGCYEASSFEDLLDHGMIDAIAIATPNHLHLSQVTAALDHGLHVFVEKPIANQVDDGIKMIDAAESRGKVLMVGHHMRFNRASRKAKELLDGGTLGEIVSIELHYSANNTPHYSKYSWRLQPEYCPLLPVTQLAIHGIDVIHYLFSQIETVTATARSVTVDAPVYDSVSALMQTRSGIAVTLTSNYCSPVLFEIRIATTTRNLIYRPHLVELTPKLGMEGDADEWTRFDYSDNTFDGYEAEIEVFRDALAASNVDVEANGRDGLQALAVDAALRRSIASGSRVQVADFVHV